MTDAGQRTVRKPGALQVRIGINPISWSNDDLPSLGGETPLDVALAEGAAIGYEGFELGNKFPREPEASSRTAWRSSPAGIRDALRAGRSTTRSPRWGRT